jgi:3-oxoacyl-[acyl-carrier protein] reductase
MKRSLITGASRGIGRAIAVRLAAEGHHLLLCGRDRQALDSTGETARRRGSEVTPIAANLAEPSEVAAVVQEAGAGPLDLLVHNAGVAYVKSVEKTEPEEWLQTLAVNVTAPFLLTRGLLPVLSEGSAVVHILSVAARTGFPGWSSYCMSKFALEGFSQSLREELRPRRVRVVNVYPSAVDTDIWSNISGSWDRSRMIAAEEVAEAIAYALSRPADVAVSEISLGDTGGTL